MRTGLAANMIANVADTEHVDAIFLTNDGPAGLFRRLLGGIPERVSHTSPAPVLVQRGVIPSSVGPAAPAGGPEQPSYLRVLVPVDGSPEGEAALEPAAILAGALSSPGEGSLQVVQILIPKASAQERTGPRHISRARSSDCARRRSTRCASPPTGPSPRVRIRLRRWRGSPAPRPTPARARSTSSPSRLHQRSAPSAGPSTM